MEESWLMLAAAFFAGAVVAALMALVVVVLRESRLRAQLQVETRRDAETLFERRKADLDAAISQTYEARLAEWKVAEEKRIRRSTANGSRAVIKGKVAEQLAPLLPGFDYNPSDARFIGDPVDYLIFKGYTDLRDGDGQAQLEIVILDVKTGDSAGLTREQRAIRDAIAAQRVRFQVARVHPETLAIQLE